MVWNSDWPVGTVSVRANRVTGNQNTTYIETTMGKSVVGTNTDATRDHFWAIDPNLDGRHRFIQSPVFTDGVGAALNPVLGASMDAIIYAKTTNAEAQWFHKNVDNNDNLYQITPNQLLGTKVLTGSYATVIAVPANVWGEIFMYATNGTANQSRYRTVRGFFRSDATTVNTFAYAYLVEGSSTATIGVKFGNGSDASGLNIRARSEEATTGLTWNYIVWYRAI